MDRDRILQILREHQEELRAAGIVHLRLFGSVFRNQASPHSDVDLLADLDRTKRFSLLTMAHLENQLSDLLRAKVDLSPVDSMKDQVRKEAMREAVLAF